MGLAGHCAYCSSHLGRARKGLLSLAAGGGEAQIESKRFAGLQLADRRVKSSMLIGVGAQPVGKVARKAELSQAQRQALGAISLRR